MTGKYFVILINSGSRPTPYEAIQGQIGPDDWLRLSANQVFVYSHRQAKELWKAIVPVLDPADFAIVVEAIPPNGWMTSSQLVSDWFAKPRL